MATYVAHEMKISFAKKRSGKSTGKTPAKAKSAEVDFISMLISLVI